MALKNILVFFVAAFALVAFASGVSAFGQIQTVEVNGQDALASPIDFANFAGETVTIRVAFLADSSSTDPTVGVAEDVRVKAWFTGESENAAVSERFDTLAG